VFVIIVAFTILQRFILRERKVSRRRMRLYNLPTSAREGNDGDGGGNGDGDGGGDGDRPRTDIAVGIATQSQVSRGGGAV
jgi:hypothetical protein